MNKYIEGLTEYQKGYGLAQSTIKRNRYILNIFFRWLGNTDIKDVDKKSILSFRNYLKEYISSCTCKSLRSTTIRVYMTVVKGLFDYLIRYELILSNPMENLKIKEDSKKNLRSIFSKEDINTFLDSISIGTTKGIRDRACFELMYSSGLRASDVLRLEIDNLQIDERILIVRGKGNKDRYVPFSETARKFLIIYLNRSRRVFLRKLYKKNDSRFVFLNPSAKLKYQQLRIIFDGYIKKCNLTRKGYTIHSIRHATATHLLANGASIRYVQELLGHENLKTTQLYTHPTIDNIKAVYRTFHPRENEYYRDVDDKYLEEVKKLKERVFKGSRKSAYYREHGTTKGFEE